MHNAAIFAELLGLATWVWIVLFVAMFFVSIAILFSSRYKRCPSNKVLVIYGRTGAGNVARPIHGGAKLVWPLIQDYAYMSLEPIQIEIPLRGALSIENIRVNVPSVFTVAIGTTPEVMQNASIRLLGLNTAAIEKQAEEIIFGQLRQVIASMRIEDINRDRDTFLEHVQSSLEPELKKVGLVLINVNITDITDESGYIDAIGQKAASTAIQQARGDVAEQEKLGESRVAEAERDKQIQVANANKLREIGTREAAREQAVRVATLDREQKVAEQQAVFERESQVKIAEQAMRVQVADANAKAVEGENLSQAVIAASQAELMVKKAEAYQAGESRKREAEAAVLEIQNRAMAKAALAEAERVEAERRAAVEAPAKAEKARILVEAEAEAEKRRIEAEGEARAIYARLEAEARGNYEILAKKGEGLQRIIDACGGAKEAFQLLMLEHFDNLVEASAKAISNIKFDKVIVWENGTQNGHSTTANFLQNMARTLPPMMQVMKDIGGVELPESLVKFAGDGDRIVKDVREEDLPDEVVVRNGAGTAAKKT
ncbi:MAG TPA: SPFH domain-containing protein [Pirellulales bacterium]|nr:SPFH domain-containing protein [Pirellulales bacterium]